MIFLFKLKIGFCIFYTVAFWFNIYLYRFTMKTLGETWINLQKIIEEREIELHKEHNRQENNDKLRREFARQVDNMTFGF